jgi:hypothetical protein
MKGLLIIALCFVGFVFADEPVEITFGTMYIKDGKAYEFSPALEDLAGQKVTMKGYAAPPLRADWKFFVLTRIPMAVCPFCSSDAEWPPDIVLIKLPNNFDDYLFGGFQVTGTLELGSETDPDTGFVSRVRIIADSVVRP